MQGSSHTLSRLGVVLDDDEAVASVVLPMTLAQLLGVREMVDASVDPRDAPGHANVGL